MHTAARERSTHGRHPRPTRADGRLSKSLVIRRITAVGLAPGTAFVIVKRSLWPTILAHGTVDTLGFVEDYLGA